MKETNKCETKLLPKSKNRILEKKKKNLQSLQPKQIHPSTCPPPRSTAVAKY